MIEAIATSAIRKILNGAIGNSKPNDLINAIKDNRSLWGEGSDVIRKHANSIPAPVMGYANNFVKKINNEYGGFPKLVKVWLNEDQPILYSIIINTNGGEQWLERQIFDILVGLNIDPRAM